MAFGGRAGAAKRMIEADQQHPGQPVEPGAKDGQRLGEPVGLGAGRGALDDQRGLKLLGGRR